MSEQKIEKRGKHWYKGMASPNPKGRPRTGLALAEMIREVVGEPESLRELVQMAHDIARCRAVSIDEEWLRESHAARVAGLPAPPRRGETIQPTISESQRAMEWLATWGFSKMPTEVKLTSSGAPIVDFNRLAPEELDLLEQMQLKMLVQSADE